MTYQTLELPNGYKLTTTFWNDFTIADKFGVAAIKDTFNRAFKEWKTDYVYLTELVIVLNHKIWEWYSRPEPFAQEYSRLYNDLWEKADEYACDNLRGEEASFFYEVTD